MSAPVHAVLAARSDFTIGQSTASPKALAKAAKAAGAEALGITDDMTVTGLVALTGACAKEGLKPIVGCRIRLSDDPTWRKPKGDRKAKAPADFYVTAYVRTEAGLRCLYRVISLGNDGDHFYNAARVSLPELCAELGTVSGADLAIATSDAHGLASHPRFEDLLADLAAAIGHEHVHLTLTAVDTPYYDTLNARSVRANAAGRHPYLVTRPVAYQAGGADVADTMAALAKNTELASLWATRPHQRDAHPMGREEFATAVREAALRLVRQRGLGPEAPKAFAAGLAGARALVDSVSYAWSKAPVSLPAMADDEFGAVVAACRRGWAERFSRSTFGHCPTPEEQRDVYMPRLRFELETLKRLSFSGYFLLVADVVNFAKGAGIRVGPGRGSVGGSLVAYLMGITDCDPIRFDLLFERFINPDRLDLPDADLDFASARRHEVVSYLIGRYGADHVAGVTNFGTLQSASALGQVAKAHGLSEFETTCTKLMPKHAGVPLPLDKAAPQVPEIDAFRRRHPAVWAQAEALQGVMRSLGQHAAGIVVAGVPIVERAAIERRKAPKAAGPDDEAVAVETVVCWDKRIIEDQGLVKMDILGLSTLDLIDLAMRYVRERTPDRVPDLMDLDLADEAVLAEFARGNTLGVFQFDGGGMRRLLKNLGAGGAVTFEDVTACTALYRPGPMESGMMDSYWKRKQGTEPVEYIHPKIREATEGTYGVLVYQEQVMKTSREVAGYSAGQADKLRKIMGKKLPEEMEKERPNFVKGCVETVGMSEQSAGELFDKIAVFAGYGFNRAHSVEYTLISFQSAYLKTHHPVEFFAAALTLMKADFLPGLLSDARRLGIDVSLPDVNASTARFEIVSDTELVIPFSRVKGLTAATSKAILDARAAGPFASKADLLARVNRRACNVAKVDVLDRIGALAGIEPGTPPRDDESRIRDQRDLIPGLVTTAVPIHRKMPTAKHFHDGIAAIVDRYQRDEADDGMPVKPHFGRTARFLVLSDCPSGGRDGDEANGSMGHGRGFEPVVASLAAAGLSKSDGYWTALCKRPKAGKTLSAAEVERYAPYLSEELALLKPPVIVTLGSAALRRLVPDWKGRCSESAGKVIYLKDIDCNLVVGFSPGELYYAPEKQADLDKVFEVVAELSK